MSLCMSVYVCMCVRVSGSGGAMDRSFHSLCLCRVRLWHWQCAHLVPLASPKRTCARLKGRYLPARTSRRGHCRLWGQTCEWTPRLTRGLPQPPDPGTPCHQAHCVLPGTAPLLPEGPGKGFRAALTTPHPMQIFSTVPKTFPGDPAVTQKGQAAAGGGDVNVCEFAVCQPMLPS